MQGIGCSDKTPVLTQNLPDEQCSTKCVVLPVPTSTEPDLALAGMEEAVSLWKQIIEALLQQFRLRLSGFPAALVGPKCARSFIMVNTRVSHLQEYDITQVPLLSRYDTIVA